MRQLKLFYGSSYDRGLDILLPLWPRILEKYPDATLDICYGWDLFIAGYRDNPERMAWMEKINKLMDQKGIVHHGRVGKEKLAEIRRSCGIWAYPTYFAEINCITALSAQADGLVPVTMNAFALKETVGAGYKIDGDIYEKDTQEKWLSALLEIMGDVDKWKEESKKAQDFGSNYSWAKIAGEWTRYFV